MVSLITFSFKQTNLFSHHHSQLSKLFGIDFLQYRLWIGIWVMLICWAVVAFEGCFLVEHFTRFTEEVFSVLISLLFVYEAVDFLIKVLYYCLFPDKGTVLFFSFYSLSRTPTCGILANVRNTGASRKYFYYCG